MRIIESFREIFEPVEVLEEKLKKIEEEINDSQSVNQRLGVDFVNLHKLPQKIEELQEEKCRLQKMIEKRKSRK